MSSIEHVIEVLKNNHDNPPNYGADYIKEFIRDGFDPNQEFDDTYFSNSSSILHKCVEYDNFECMKVLLDSGADPNKGTQPYVSFKTEESGHTPLHVSCKYHQVECVEVLLEYPITNLNVVNDRGWTPMMVLAENPNTDILDMLLKRGANVNVRSNTGDFSALYIIVEYVCYHGLCEQSNTFIKKLLGAGADKTFRSRSIAKFVIDIMKNKNYNDENKQLMNNLVNLLDDNNDNNNNE